VKSICFVHTGKAQLPDLSAYKDYFAPSYKVTDSRQLKGLEQYDILWFFMGLHRYTPLKSQFVVHEYSSLSLPPFARLKDRIKVLCEKKPDLRVFQNEQQSDLMNFNDGIPAVFRDMGVADHFFDLTEAEKTYDVVYVGAMDKTRHLELAIDKLLKVKPDLSLVLVGRPEPYLVERYKNYPDIRFIGSIEYGAVPALLKQARFGLNYVPAEYPYHIQSSTKLLEYLAVGLPVIGNINPWTKMFLQKQNVVYFDLSQMNEWPLQGLALNSLPNELSKQFLWQNIIRNVGIEQYLPV
jgi:glycosyltransferase involved in cell wall biosynthesis